MLDDETAYAEIGDRRLSAVQGSWNCRTVFIARRSESTSLCFAESLDVAIECAIVRAAWSVGVIVESGEVHVKSGTISAVKSV